jgi:hypothetical protein
LLRSLLVDPLLVQFQGRLEFDLYFRH